MTKIRTGGCLCGSIRFETRAVPRNAHTCSCEICQRHSGATSLTWVEFNADDVLWTGPGGTPSTYRSSDYSSRAFCAACGSTLGAIDDDLSLRLSGQVLTIVTMRRYGLTPIPSKMSARYGPKCRA